MRDGRLAPISWLIGLLLVGVALPMPSRADDADWEPIVVKLGNTAAPRPSLPVPPLLPAKKSKTATKKPSKVSVPPAVAQAAAAAKAYASPANTSQIVTGTIGTSEPTRHLSTPDTEQLGEEAEPAPKAEITTGAVKVPESDLAQRYCANVSDTAADARIAWQQEKLAETEREIAKRIALLEEKTEEFKAWLDRRDEFSRRANETLVQIYARMEPDSAALQFIAMDEETAAAVLTKLNPRNSSAILNEMPAEKAARLTATIAGAARMDTNERPPAPPAAQPPPNRSMEPNEVGLRR